MNITIIAAVSRNNVIGIENKIPWRIKEDINRFKQLTLNHPVVMGRKTYESIPQKFKPLPQRKNIVLSSTLEKQEGVYIARTIEEALRLTDELDTFIIGGRKVYESFLPLANRMELTKIYQDFKGDSFFPEINWSDWDLVNIEKHKSNERIPYSFLSYFKI